MTPHTFSVKPSTSADQVAVILYKEAVLSLPVVDKGEVVGVIHHNKFIRKMLK